MNDSLQNFIETLSHLETIHYGFHLQKNNKIACCQCSSAGCLTPWRFNFKIDFQVDGFCKNTPFHSDGLLQHCKSKGNDYHLSTAYYL